MIIHRTTKFGRRHRCFVMGQRRRHTGNVTPFRSTKPSPTEARKARRLVMAKALRSIKGGAGTHEREAAATFQRLHEAMTDVKLVRLPQRGW